MHAINLFIQNLIIIPQIHHQMKDCVHCGSLRKCTKKRLCSSCIEKYCHFIDDRTSNIACTLQLNQMCEWCHIFALFTFAAHLCHDCKDAQMLKLRTVVNR